MFVVIFEVQPLAERWDDYLETARILRPELERIDGGFPERLQEPDWQVEGGWIDPFRDYKVTVPEHDALIESRAAAAPATPRPKSRRTGQK